MTQWIKNWFSNYVEFDTPFIYQGLEFKYPETFFQAMKVKKELLEIRKNISLMNPGQAKKFWRNTYNKKNYMREDWFNINLDVMEYIIRYKFQEGTSHFNRLIKTTGLIVETNNWHDNWWGNCICGSKKCKEEGKNHLGLILTKVRDEYNENIRGRKAS
jgi:ribA/ribD-fused uncharacterized protein